MKVKLKMDKSRMQAIGVRHVQKMNRILNSPKFRTEMHKLYAQIIDPYVPYVTGALSESGLNHATADGVKYTVDYAEKVYNSTWEHYLGVHPLASSHWDKVAMQTQRELFTKQVQELLQLYLSGKS